MIIQALDKIRFLSLTDKEVLGEGDDTKLEIQVCQTAELCTSYSSVFLGSFCHGLIKSNIWIMLKS